ncbi:MAG: HAD-IA family hydrolase [Pseudomonadota bacterium]|nr:HAD-IA family hydrolase [Pseudomonadota bacterium]
MELDTSIECVLFDLDGTLIDTALDFIKALGRLTAENNQPPVKDLRVQQTVSDGARALIKLAFDITENDDRFASLNQRLLDLYLEQLEDTDATLYPGLSYLLAQLEKVGIPWGIVTNKPEIYSRQLLDKLNLLTRCGVLVCPDHVSERKPHPEPIFLACDRLSCSTERTVYLGDHIRDIQAAKNADVIAVAAAYGYLSPEVKVEEWFADFILRSSEQALPLLNSLKFA